MNPIENNCVTAFRCFYLSAEQGNREAQFRLADLYALGYGTIKNLSDAYKWYTKSAIQGYKRALVRIHNLYQRDKKMHCRGQVDYEEENDMIGVRDLAEFRLKNEAAILNGAINYYTARFKDHQLLNQEDPILQLNLAFLYQHVYGVKKMHQMGF
jgi:TPR repeat protein